MDNFLIPGNKPRSRTCGAGITRVSVAHVKAAQALARHGRRAGGGIISFPDARLLLSWLFHFNKKESQLFLRELCEAGLATWVPFRGIRVKGSPGRRGLVEGEAQAGHRDIAGVSLQQDSDAEKGDAASPGEITGGSRSSSPRTPARVACSRAEGGDRALKARKGREV